MRHRIAALGLLAILPPFAAIAAEPAGQIEICRVRAAGDRHQGQEIKIPQGATFGDAGARENGENTGNYWPLWIATTEALTLPGDAQCVRGKAQIGSNLDHHTLRTADHRWFVPTGTATSGDEWPSDYDLGATVTADFK